MTHQTEEIYNKLERYYMSTSKQSMNDIDPVENNLLFERFLNPGRKDAPDFDLDISEERKKHLLIYIFQNLYH